MIIAAGRSYTERPAATLWALLIFPAVHSRSLYFLGAHGKVLGTLLFLTLLALGARSQASDPNSADAKAAKPAEKSTVAANTTPAKDAAPATQGSGSPAPAAPGGDSGAPYTVQEDGVHVDSKTFQGWKTWRALACERCHGPEQEGLVGPSLVNSLKVLTKEDFHTTVMNGRIEKGMPPFSSSKAMQDNWENLYAYLKGRSDGKIKPGHVQEITP